MLYFASNYYNADGAIQVTGSHNPKDYNGFKIVLNQNSFFGEDIQNLGILARKGSTINSAKGSSKKVNINDHYVEKVIEPLKNKNNLLKDKIIVWDCGNGASGPCIEKITKIIAGKHIVLYSDVDGKFPNHHPDHDTFTIKPIEKLYQFFFSFIPINFRSVLVSNTRRTFPIDKLSIRTCIRYQAAFA